MKSPDPHRRSVEAPASRRGRWNPDLHPRWPAGASNGGEFRPTDHLAFLRPENFLSLLPWRAPIDDVDFSNGFHQAVVDDWLAFFRRRGIPAIQRVSLRRIGKYPWVIGHADIIAHRAGEPFIIVEIKTGADPPLTRQQAAYIPMMQYGYHIYSHDPRVRQLGHKPGVPFPPMRAMIVYAPRPGGDYQIIVLDDPGIVLPR